MWDDNGKLLSEEAANAVMALDRLVKASAGLYEYPDMAALKQDYEKVRNELLG